MKLNRVIEGDRIQCMNKLEKGSVHLIITSPPYNMGIDYDNHDDNMSFDDYLVFLRDTWTACYRVLAHGGRICINMPSIKSDALFRPMYSYVIQQMLSLGFIMRCDILWYKHSVKKRTIWGSWKSPSNPHVVQPYEWILVFSKGNMRLLGDKDKADITKEEFIRFSYSLWKIAPSHAKNHPAPFPEELVYRLIKFYSYSGNTVMDPFAGSGTVGVVAKQCHRNYILIDKSPVYCALARKNIDIAIEQKKIKF